MVKYMWVISEMEHFWSQ